MARITLKEVIEERRQQAWSQWNQGLTHSEIAAVLHYPRRTITNDIVFTKQRREQERRLKAERQEHEARGVLEEARVTLDALKKQALLDFNALSITTTTPGGNNNNNKEGSGLLQAEDRKDMYNIRMAIEDARIELALMSDRLEQKEVLTRIRSRSDNLSNQLNGIEKKRSINNSNATTVQEESTVV